MLTNNVRTTSRAIRIRLFSSTWILERCNNLNKLPLDKNNNKETELIYQKITFFSHYHIVFIIFFKATEL